jgi:hypothetical protein
MTNAATKPLTDLTAGDVIKTNEGRAEWLRIVTISADTVGEARFALVEQMGGKRKGQRFSMVLHNYNHGWVVKH